jgi:ATP-dependent exoDNAse (exonuclease V) beta subunit
MSNFIEQEQKKLFKPSKKFTRLDLNLPRLDRTDADGLRYYTINGKEELGKFISVTTVTSHYNKEKFSEWRRKVGEEKANLITKAATSRGTALHNINEKYLLNEIEDNLERSTALTKLLFNAIRPYLDKIDNIHALEDPLFSEFFRLAGTVDCIAEYEGVLSVIDFKTAEKPKPREWIENYFVQAAAYAFMFKELTGIEVKQIVIMMACENSEVEIYKELDIKKYIRLLVQYVKKYTDDKLKQL